jgi:hypothetical protein
LVESTLTEKLGPEKWRTEGVPGRCIMAENWEHFEDMIGDQDWLVNDFAEMNRTRQALAHTGTLTETDVERMEFRVRE